MARIKVEDWLTDDSLRKLELYKRRGLSDKQIAEQIGISDRTLRRWKNSNPSVLSALQKGKQAGIDQVEVTMFDKALGYYDQEDGYHPPETTAGIFILKNMRTDHYRDKPMSRLEEEKLRQETERLRLDNEIKRRILEGDGELDQLEELIKGIDRAALSDAEEVLDE